MQRQFSDPLLSTGEFTLLQILVDTNLHDTTSKLHHLRCLKNAFVRFGSVHNVSNQTNARTKIHENKSTTGISLINETSWQGLPVIRVHTAMIKQFYAKNCSNVNRISDQLIYSLKRHVKTDSSTLDRLLKIAARPGEVARLHLRCSCLFHMN